MRVHRTTPQEIWGRAIAARHYKRPRQRIHGFRQRCSMKWRAYFVKMRGEKPSELVLYPVEALWSFVGSFLGIGLLSLCNRLLLGGESQLLLMGTFGASAMLLFGAPQGVFSQPRNVIGGHVLSALVGVSVCKLLGPDSAWAAPLAVSTAIALMHLSCTLHPPGGGTALLMVSGSPQMLSLGYKAVLFPVLSGACILVLAALLTNNLSRDRHYPVRWW